MGNLTVNYYRHKILPNYQSLGLDKISFNEITFVKSGSITYYVDGIKIPLGAGDGVFIKKGQMRKRESKDKFVDYISFNFDADYELNLPTHYVGALTPEISILILACDEVCKNTLAKPFDVISPIFEGIIKVMEKHFLTKSENPLTTNIKKYIRDNLSDKITLSELSKSTFYSPVYLETVFKKDTGKSIIDYLLDERINEAKNLLCEGILSLQDIAGSVGIYDYNYFSRIFKKKVGYTPTQYRKQLNFKK